MQTQPYMIFVIPIQFLNVVYLEGFHFCYIGGSVPLIIGFLVWTGLQDLLPTIINQLGPDNLDNLRRLAEQFQKQVPGAETGAGAAAQDDDDVPELVPGETFEEAAEEKKEPEPEEKKES